MGSMRGQIARTIVPKTVISASAAAWTASSYLDFSEKLPSMPINRLLVTMFADNVTDEATYAELLSELINSLYFKSTRLGVIFDISGGDLEQLLRRVLGIPQLPVTGGTADNNERTITYPVTFGRKYDDFDLGLPAHTLGQMQIRHQMGTSSGSDGADYKVSADCLETLSPRYCLQALTMTDTPAATGKKRYSIPVGAGSLLMGLLLRTTTAYEAGAVNEPKLLIDEKDVSLEFETSQLAARNLIDRKVTGFTVYNDTQPRIEEGLNNPTLYYYLDFGPDIDGWLNPNGKPIQLELNVATAEALRIIPVVALKV